MADNSSQNHTSSSINHSQLPEEVDLSGIEIIDTSRGDTISFGEDLQSKIFSFKCLECGFKYEGCIDYDACPRCGSSKLIDSQDI